MPKRRTELDPDERRLARQFCLSDKEALKLVIDAADAADRSGRCRKAFRKATNYRADTPSAGGKRPAEDRQSSPPRKHL